MRWACESCIRKVAGRWQAILTWASQHGSTPKYCLTLTLRDPLPLWRQAPPARQPAPYEQAVAVTERLTRALSHLVEEIRQQFGPVKYLAVVEFTTGKRTPGHRPHLTILVRGQPCPGAGSVNAGGEFCMATSRSARSPPKNACADGRRGRFRPKSMGFRPLPPFVHTK
jgi:hypothetical protein